MKNKKIFISICLLIIMMTCVACNNDNEPKKVSYGLSNSTIVCNIVKDELTLNDVTFYDELSGKLIKNKSGEFYVVSKSYNSEAITFETKKGEWFQYCLTTNIKLKKCPEEFNVFKDSTGSKYDTYIRTELVK